MSSAKDFVVIGGGPGGYAAAFRAADLGRSVTLIDAGDKLGGVCLNRGCIPSKTLLHAAEAIRLARKMDGWGISFGPPRLDLYQLRTKVNSTIDDLARGLAHLARRRNVEVLTGHATFDGPESLTVHSEAGNEHLTFRQAVIATGSHPLSLPGLPENEPRILDSTGALELAQIPDRLMIVGGGIIGLEVATIFGTLGSKVTIVETAGHLMPGADPDAASLVEDELRRDGCRVLCQTRVGKVACDPDALRVTCEGKTMEQIEADAILVAVGRRAASGSVGLATAGITPQDDATIAIDAQCRTSVPHIFAVGDVTGAPMLAHHASHQGKVAAEAACGQVSAVDTDFVPSVAYCHPEVAWVGHGAHDLEATGVAFETSVFPWRSSGRNRTTGGSDGLTKLFFDPETSRLFGAVIVGAHAGELIGEIGLGLEMGAVLEDLGLSIHAHPGYAETIGFAAEMALGTCTDV